MYNLLGKQKIKRRSRWVMIVMMSLDQEEFDDNQQHETKVMKYRYIQTLSVSAVSRF